MTSNLRETIQMKFAPIHTLRFMVASLGLLAASAHASVLINGDFETGSLSGWTITNQAGGSGNWYRILPAVQLLLVALQRPPRVVLHTGQHMQ